MLLLPRGNDAAEPDDLVVIRAAWRWLSGAVTILVVAFALAYAIMRAFSPVAGPVVEVIEGPGPDRVTVPYGGTISYPLTTRRIESCPGVVTRTWLRRSSDEQRGARFESSSPILSAALRTEPSSTVVTVEVPRVVTPGLWVYTAAVASDCPLRHATDILARFEVEVTEVAQ